MKRTGTVCKLHSVRVFFVVLHVVTVTGPMAVVGKYLRGSLGALLTSPPNPPRIAGFPSSGMALTLLRLSPSSWVLINTTKVCVCLPQTPRKNSIITVQLECYCLSWLACVCTGLGCWTHKTAWESACLGVLLV